MPVKAPSVRVRDSYLALVRRFPIREIRTPAEHRAAGAIVRELMLRGDADLDEGEVDYLSALGRFVEDYERSHFLRDVPPPTPLQVVELLMEQRDMSPSDLGRVIGSNSAASMILSGAREPSKSQIRKLAEHFHVSAALFI
jgi:HTH-type transcriptional regulator/antitoxin HigA